WAVARQCDGGTGAEALAKHRDFRLRRGGADEIEAGARIGAQSELRRIPARAAITAPVDRQNAEPAVLQLVEPPDLIGYRAGRAVQEQHDAALRRGRRPPPRGGPPAARPPELSP